MKNFKNISRLIIQGVHVLVCKRAEEGEITVDTSENIQVEEKGDVLLIQENATENVTSLPAGIEITHSVGGGISVKNVSGRNVSIINSQVLIDGKLVSGVAPEKVKPVTISIPDSIALEIKACGTVTMQSHRFRDLHMEVHGEGSTADTLTTAFDAHIVVSGQGDLACSSLHVGSELEIRCSGQSSYQGTKVKAQKGVITTSGQATCKVENIICSVLECTASGMGTIKCKATTAKKVQLVTSGQAEIKVVGLLDTVVAKASGMSSCKFSMPRNQPFTSKSGMATCKVI